MLDHDDLKWIASTSTDLNSILQQVSRYTDLIRRHKGEHNYIDLLVERVELAGKTAQALFDRVTSRILAQTAAKTAPPPAPDVTPFTVVPLPLPPVRVLRTEGKTQVGAARHAARLATKPEVARVSGNGIPPEIKVTNPKGNREYLLLVEDEIQVAEVAAEMLAEEGYKVIVAHDGFEALKIYRNVGKQIGLVILDFFLPVMDGDAVFDELRALNPNVNVVLSSGFAEQQKISGMLAQGLRGFIPKPYSSEKLLGQVRSTLDAGRQRLG
ncbi:MAG: response regulator [Chthoniobacterales bacterium]